MNNVLNEISQWATSLPYWEQAALEKIVTGVTFADSDYDELLQYLLEDAKLAMPAPARPVLTFPQAIAAAGSSAGKLFRLSKISNLCHINALVTHQELTFGPALTAVFGANGSGKSGYARVIGSAAFTRGDKQILMDVTQPTDTAKVMMADVELTDETDTYAIHYQIGQSCSQMRSFYVFDSTSVRAHLTKSNAMSFAPAGLGYLTQLADITDQVRKRLQVKIDQRTHPNNPFLPLFPGQTEVSQLIATLGSTTNVAMLHRLGTLSNQEEVQITGLDQQIARLKSEDIPQKIEEISQIIVDLRKLTAALNDLEQHLGDERLTQVNDQLTQWHIWHSASQKLGVEQFKTEFFSQTGSEAWQDFIKAAHLLAHTESASGQLYPQTENRCLLCHQILSAEAIDLLNRLWAFLEGDAQVKLATIETTLEDYLRALENLDLDFFDDQTVSYRHLQAQDKQTLSTAKIYLDACCQRRYTVLLAIQNRHEVVLSALPENAIDGIERVIARLEIEQTEWEAKNPANEIAVLEQQKLELEHRQRLGQYLPQIEQFIADCIWANNANNPKVRRSTAHISKKYNDLFGQLVTQKYIQLFQDTLKKLCCPLRVKVQTRAHKGETFKQITLETDATISADQAPPDKILSEGEQRAVALADFLTEVALDTNSTGVILDDPVTSLDFAWKETIAAHLVEEAKQRQVIVFTHDLHFLYCLKEHAVDNCIELAAHWIEKRDGKPGWVFLNNSPLAEKDYKNTNKVKKIHEQAIAPNILPEEQQRLLGEGFGALRTCYEAFVIFDLFAEVVMRFGERISIDRLRKVVIDPDIRDQVIDKVGLLSRYIEGHLHSDPYLAQKPTPELLLKEITEFEALKKKHKEFKKAQGISD